MNDLRYALRTLARSPGFTFVAVVTLALGIGANTAVFSVVEAVLLRSLPFPGAERLLLIRSKSGTSPLRAYETWRTATGAFEDMAAVRLEAPVLIAPEGAERVSTWTVTASFFPLLGGRPSLGRPFLPEAAALNLVSRRSQDDDHGGRAFVPVVEPLQESLVGRVRTPLLLMLGAVSLVLLVVCANVASLLLSRGV